MHYFIANLDKQEYIKPVALGAPRGSKKYSVAKSQAVKFEDRNWQFPFIYLLEPHPLTPKGKPAKQQGDRPGSYRGRWAGNRIVLVRPKDYNPAFAESGDDVLAALGSAPDELYTNIKKTFTDITQLTLTDFQAFLQRNYISRPAYENMEYDRICKPKGYAWMTGSDLERCYMAALGESAAKCDLFLNWLYSQPGVSKPVQTLINTKLQLLASMKPQPKVLKKKK